MRCKKAGAKQTHAPRAEADATQMHCGQPSFTSRTKSAGPRHRMNKCQKSRYKNISCLEKAPGRGPSRGSRHTTCDSHSYNKRAVIPTWPVPLWRDQSAGKLWSRRGGKISTTVHRKEKRGDKAALARCRAQQRPERSSCAWARMRRSDGSVRSHPAAHMPRLFLHERTRTPAPHQGAWEPDGSSAARPVRSHLVSVLADELLPPTAVPLEDSAGEVLHKRLLSIT